MSPASLAAVYFTVGIACGALVFARDPDGGARTAASAVAAVLIWPLWAPFALSERKARPRGPFADRIAQSLEEGSVAVAVAGSTAPAVLSRRDRADLVRQVELAEHRLAELDTRIASVRRARSEAADTTPREEGGVAPSPRAAHAEILDATVRQLEWVRSREHAALAELADLCDLLRTQLLLVRLGGSGKVLELRDELLTRVQVLNDVGR